MSIVRKFAVAVGLAVFVAPAMAEPPLKLDHVIIYSMPGAPEKAALEKEGFTIAPMVNHHDGQGTSSVTIEFLNGYLELLYRDEKVPVSAGNERVADLFDGRSNWPETGYSPFGLQLAKTAAAPAEFPFPTTKVHADWMEPSENLELLTPRNQPFVVGLSVPPHATDEAANTKLAADPVKGAMFHHANGAQRLTSVKITVPTRERVPSMAAYVSDAGAAAFEVSSEWLMELTLDSGRQGKSHDFRPVLPLIVRY